MIERILKVKNWQLIMVSFGMTFIIQMTILHLNVIGSDPSLLMSIMPIIMSFFLAGYFWCI